MIGVGVLTGILLANKEKKIDRNPALDDDHEVQRKKTKEKGYSLAIDARLGISGLGLLLLDLLLLGCTKKEEEEEEEASKVRSVSLLSSSQPASTVPSSFASNSALVTGFMSAPFLLRL